MAVRCDELSTGFPEKSGYEAPPPVMGLVCTTFGTCSQPKPYSVGIVRDKMLSGVFPCCLPFSATDM